MNFSSNNNAKDDTGTASSQPRVCGVTSQSTSSKTPRACVRSKLANGLRDEDPIHLEPTAREQRQER